MPEPGPALDWTDEDIEDLADVDRAARDDARDWWRELAPAGYATLLNAQPEPATDRDREALAVLGLAVFFFWRRRRGVYVSRRTGRIVSPRQLRGVVDRIVAGSAGNVRAQTQALREGRITLAQWQARMSRELQNLHLATAAQARGGIAQLTQADLDRIRRITGEQHVFLRRFAEQIDAGEQVLDGTALRRADMYAQAGRNTYHEFSTLNMLDRGFDEVRSILNARESCTVSSRPGCIEEAARGFVPVGEHVPLGERTCLTNCQCSLEFRDRETGETRVVA